MANLKLVNFLPCDIPYIYISVILSSLYPYGASFHPFCLVKYPFSQWKSPNKMVDELMSCKRSITYHIVGYTP